MEITKIARLIHEVRGHRVMLDADLAVLYGVSTGNFNKSVHRKLARFPSDFLFRLTVEEHESLIFQSGISKKVRGGRRFSPFAFTEQGVAMLSSVLNSERAISVNIEIIRAFVRLRSAVLAGKEIAERVHKLEKAQSAQEKELGEHAVEIHQVFVALRKMGAPP